MATIDKNLIHFNRLADFEARLAAGEIRDYSIVCIKDAKKIWTHGEYYGDLSECLTKYPQEFTKEEKEQMLENLGYYAIEWDGSSETIELSDEEYRKVLSATNVYLVWMDIRYLFPTARGNGQYVYLLVEDGGVVQFSLDTSTNPMSISHEDVPIPTATSELTNDSGFVSAVDAGEEVDDVEPGYVTEAEFNSALSSKQDTIADLGTIRSGASKGTTAVQPSELASVARSGSYNDLTDKPSIPSIVTESTVSGWGFTKNTGTYSKPSTGIPKSDLASAVQTSLNKADTALQSHQDISGKQDKLVSGTSIKTINGTSILGSGNIVIEGGVTEEYVNNAISSAITTTLNTAV